MTTTAARIAIIGAGLSGLYAALLLEQKGIKDYIILEARTSIGGRIVSVSPSAPATEVSAASSVSIDKFDLGPSWFWPEFQHQLDRLLDELGLDRYEQYEDGNMVMERSPDLPPVTTPGFFNSPSSMRLVGGMAALIDALRKRVDESRIHTGQIVKSLRCEGERLTVISEDMTGLSAEWSVEHVLLAVPPRLAANSIEFVPSLPNEISRKWLLTATWMAPHAKYFAVYDEPFWRAEGLSGQGRSRVGPMGEIHDASIPGGNGALFGFVGLPARIRKDIPERQMQALCRAQLVRMFGEQAGKPKAEFYKDWALESFTATVADMDSSGQHAAAPASTINTGPWSGRLAGVASEWSPQFPGYVAGAVEAASRAVQAIQPTQTRNDERSAS